MRALFFSLMTAFLIVGCGSDDSNTTTQNNPPVAHAGAEQTVTVGALVALDASQSLDPDGDALTYAWRLVTIPEGSEASLLSPDAQTSSFTADLPGEFVVELVVNDGELDSAPVRLTVSATATQPQNRAPLAVAGEAQSVVAGTSVSLDGSGSSDPDGDDLIYIWRLVTVPEGSEAALTSPDTKVASFIADLPGAFVVELIVNDGELDSSPARLTVTVTKLNHAPVAVAGEDVSVATATEVTLDATASSDPDGDTLTYAWTLVSKPVGSDAAIDPSDQTTALLVPDRAGDYVVRLVVSDGEFDHADELTVSVYATWTASQEVAGFYGATVLSNRTGLILALHQGTGYTIETSQYDTETDVWSAPELVIDPTYIYTMKGAVSDDGTVVLVWEEDTVGGTRLSAMLRDPVTGWGAPTVLTTPTTDDLDLFQVAIDAEGRAVVIWVQSRPNYDLMAARYLPGTGWSAPEVLDTETGEARRPVVSVDAGKAVVVWTQTASSGTDQLRARSGDVATGIWDAVIDLQPQGRPNDDSDYPALAVGASGERWLVWLVSVQTGVMDVLVRHYDPVGQIWADPVMLAVADATNSTSLLPTLAANDSGDVVVGWAWSSYPVTEFRTRVYRASTGTWSAPVTEADIGGFSVAISPSGEVVRGWAASGVTPRALSLSRGDGTNWDTPTVVGQFYQPGHIPFLVPLEGDRWLAAWTMSGLAWSLYR